MANIFEWNPNQTATGKGLSVATITDQTTGIVEGVSMECDRVGTKTFVDRDNIIQSTLDGEPAMTLKDGVLVASLEGEDTNYLDYSESFIPGTGWATAGLVTITPDYETSPDPKKMATRLVYDDANLNFFKAFVGYNKVASIFIKGVSGETITYNWTGTNQTHTLSGGWDRILVLDTLTRTSFSLSTFSGATARDISIFGAEIKDTDSSYIPTDGSAATRFADKGFKTPDISSLINLNSENLKLTFDVSFLNNDSADSLIGLTDQTSENYILIGNEIIDAGEKRIRLLIKSNNTTVVYEDIKLGIVDTSDRNTYTVEISNNTSYVFKIGSTELSSGTMTSSPVGLSYVRLFLANNSFSFKGNVYNLKIES